ncbi:MAG: type III pantothenate kinase [Candidatus Cloacimonetes bacterium]|nr:type III pantothenate kinase [Candidatus Cloacimonadota bacterium]
MKSQQVVIDVGNTHTVVGVYTGAKKLFWRIESRRKRTADEYWSILQSLAGGRGIDLSVTEIAAMSSVVPKLTGVFRELTEHHLGCRLINVTCETDLGLTYPVSDASYIGADLLVDAFAALEKYRCNCIVCDFGSATTIQLTGADGYFYGTVICPGLQTSAEGLVSKAAQLTGVDFGGEFGLLGTSTREAMLSGIIRGHALMIDGFILQLREEFSTLNPIKVVATGGIAKLVSRFSKLIDVVDETLTLDGLALIIGRVSD